MTPKSPINIEINFLTNEINLLVNNEEINKRLNEIPLKELNIDGYLRKFSKLCGTFENGYIT